MRRAMAIVWDDSLATGDATIDGQHRELFGRVNQLLEACGEGKGKKAVTETVGFLEDYARQHFRAEERLMTLSKYPGEGAQRRAHVEFMERVAELRACIGKSGAGLDLVISTNRLLVDWLINHVRKMDKALAQHLHQAKR